MPFCSYLGK